MLSRPDSPVSSAHLLLLLLLQLLLLLLQADALTGEGCLLLILLGYLILIAAASHQDKHQHSTNTSMDQGTMQLYHICCACLYTAKRFKSTGSCSCLI